MLEAFYQNLYGPGFVYSVDRAFVASCRTVPGAGGQRRGAPVPISEEVATLLLLPNAEFIPEWKTRAALEAATSRIKQFLAKHTPARA